MKFLIVLNDPPYGTERSYNGLRLALSLAKRPEAEVKLFLMADAALCAKSGQVTAEGYYNIERMLKGLSNRGVPIGVCGTCMDARGLTDGELTGGASRSTMEELTDWTIGAERVIVF